MSETKSVLFELQVDISKSVEQLAQYEVQLEGVNDAISELQKKQKSGEQLSAQERAELIRLKEVRKALQKEMNDQSRQIQNAIVAEGKYKDTLKGLCAELSSAKDKLRAMKLSGEENSRAYQEQSDYVDQLNTRIKEMEAAYGVHTRNVGNYASAVEGLKTNIHTATQELVQLTAAGKEGTEEFAQAQATLNGFADELASSNQNTLEFCNGGLTAVMGAMTVMTQVMGADSEEAKKMQEVMQKLQIATMALAAITQLYQALQKKGIIQKIAENVQVKAGVAATLLETKAKTSATGATVAQTAAQTALNAVMNANPIFLIITGVVALGAALAGLASWLLNSSDAQEEANRTQKAYEDQMRKSDTALASLEANEKARAVSMTARHQRQLMEMMQSGATAEEIEKEKQKFEEDTLKETAKNAKERQKLAAADAAKAEKAYKDQKAYLDELIRKKGADAEKTKEQRQAVDDLYKTWKGHINDLNDAIASENQAYYQQVENRYNAAQSASDKAYERAKARIDNLEKIRAEKYKQAFLYIDDLNKSAQENEHARWLNSMKMELNLFLEQQRIAKQKLETDRKFGKISKKEYEEQLKLLAEEEKTFNKERAIAATEYARELLEEAINLAGGKTMQDMITDTQKQFDFARERIVQSSVLSEEEKQYYILQLNEQEAKAIQDIQLKAKQETISKIESMVEDLYRYDERQFSANEIEKTELAIEKQKKIIEEKKKQGLKSYGDEVELAQMEYDLRVLYANKELQIEWNNAKEQYRIRKEFLEKELALANLSAEQRAALEEELAYITAEANMKKVEAAENYASQAMDILSSVNDLMNNLGDKEVAKAEADNNAQKASLDKRLKAGLISQKQYDKEVNKLDEDLDKKKAAIERKAAIRQKAMSIMQIAINTAAAIMKIWAEVPKVDFGVSTGVLTALAATAGAMQLAAVIAEPIPQARKGGLVQGVSHEQGGVLVNTEGDERIISANPSRAFPELLNLISYIGKHANIPSTGFGVTSAGVMESKTSSIDLDGLSSVIAANIRDALTDLKIYTAITEVREADRNYTIMENNAKI